jgi:hypothetical protein
MATKRPEKAELEAALMAEQKATPEPPSAAPTHDNEW